MITARSRMLAASVACLAVLGCTKPTTSGPTASTSTTSPPSSPSITAAAGGSGSAAATPALPSGSAAATAADLAALARYSAALGKGRRLTTKKDFAGAIEAFDEALAALPHDARAVSERGYARLQAGDLDGAEADFYEALARSPDPKVSSAVTYNLAVVAERRGNGALASELKDAANAQRKPTPPSGRCDVDVKRGKAIETLGEMKRPKTLREARAEVAAWNASHGDPPLAADVLAAEDEGTLRRVWLGEGGPPWDVVRGENHHLLAGSPGDYRLLLGAASPRRARCGSTQSVRVDLAPMPSASSFYWDMGFGLACPNGGLPANGDTTGCSTGCLGPAWKELQTIVFDPKTLEAVLEVEYSEMNAKDATRPAVAVVVKGDGVQIVGGGCNRFEPYRK